MTAYSDARIYGGTGSILVILTVVPTVGWVLGIAGFILILLALKRLSSELGDRHIFTNAIISVIFAIIAVALSAILVIVIFLHYVGVNYPNGFSYMLGQSPNLGTVNWSAVAIALIPSLLVTWIFLILSGYFIRQSYRSIATKLNIPLFETGALIYFIGAITVIIMIGFLLLLVAQIIIAVAFLSIPDRVSATSGPISNA